MLENVKDAYIRNKFWLANITEARHTYTKGRSNGTALHSLTLNIYRRSFRAWGGAFDYIPKDDIVNCPEALREESDSYG